MINLSKDIAFALRMLARKPGFAFVAISTLALGIGANTAIFSIVQGVLLKPLPFRDPDRLTAVWQKTATQSQLEIAELELDDYQARNRVFTALAGYTPPGSTSAILTGAGDPVEVRPSYITRGYFSMLGVDPVKGRDFLPEETARGRNNVAILGFSFWQSRFRGAEDMVGKRITLNHQSLLVIGIMGPDVYPPDADVFLPFTRLSPEKPLPRNYHQLDVIARLRPGQTVASAQREMDALAADQARAYPTTNAAISVSVSSLRDEISGRIRDPILLLMAAVGLVLLIACGNVGNLLLVRAAARRKEIAIRLALGAGRRGIVTQFLTECLLLSAAGAILGLLVAFLCMPLIQTLGAQRIPRLQHVAIDLRVLLFTAAMALLTGLLFSLFPALRFSSSNLSQTLRAGGRTSQFDSGRLRQLLVAAEVALALVVVVAAGLLVRSLNILLDIQPGFRADHLLIARIALPSDHYKQPQVESFYRRLMPKIAAIPGVALASTTTAMPLASPVNQTRFLVQGASPPAPGQYPITSFASVDADFFKTMNIPILKGRTFQPEEVGNPEEVNHDERCIINSKLAHDFFGNQDPLGRIILTNVAVTPPEPCRIVGVVGDTLVGGLDAPPKPVLYFAAHIAREMLVVRTTTDPMAVASAIEREVAAADPNQPVSGIQSVDQVILQSLSRRSFAAVLLVTFACLGLILAALGLYGVMAYSVAQRTQEIGVRMALGAKPGSVLRLILTQGLKVTAIGLLAGIAAAFGATHLMTNLLYGVGAADPMSFVVGSLLLMGIAALACLIPAYRATRVDPLVALRYE